MDEERPIEKLLRDAARARREKAGEKWEMHPATRRLLQGEVARQFPQARRSNTRTSLWPGLAWAGAVCMAIALVLWATLPNQTRPEPELTLSKQTSVASQPQSPAAPGRERSVTRALSKAEDTQAVSEAKDTADATVTRSLATTEFGLGETNQPAPQSERLWALRSQAPASAAMEPQREAVTIVQDGQAGPALAKDEVPHLDSNVAAVREPTFAANFKTLQTKAPETARFERRAAAPVKPAQHGTVLESFYLNQVGSQIEVVDQDGSVYKGEVQSAPSLAGAAQAAKGSSVQSERSAGILGLQNVPSQTTPSPASDTPIAQSGSDASSAGAYGYYSQAAPPGMAVNQAGTLTVPQVQTLNFRVVGTNKTLSRNVEFVGTLSINNFNKFSNNIAPAQQAEPLRNNALQNQITGQIKVEGMAPQTLEATQAP